MKILVCPTEINDVPRIAVRNEVFDPAFPGLMKQVPGSRWLPELKCWHIPQNAETWATFKALFQGYEIVTDTTKLSSELPKPKSPDAVLKPPYQPEIHLPFLLAPPEHIIIRFSSAVPDRFFVSVHKTRGDWFNLLKGIEGRIWHPDIKHWSFANTDINKAAIKRIVGKAIQVDRNTDLSPGPLPERAPKPVKTSRPESLFDRLNDEQKTAVGKMEAALHLERKEYSTIKSYRNCFIQFLYAHEEITKVFSMVGNLKHKCLLMLLYGSGLRVGEVVQLKMQDLDFAENTLFVHRGKGNKDRHTLLSANTAECIRRYIDEYKPRIWLFESPEGGQYSTRSVQQVFTNALKAAQIDKRVGTHVLRHSFATHLLQSSGNLDLVRKVLGHNSIETTQIYLHVSKTDLQKTRSPLDDLKI